jgi:hypothetical protein
MGLDGVKIQDTGKGEKSVADNLEAAKNRELASRFNRPLQDQL